MNNKVRNVLSQNFEWMKKDFIILISLIIISSIIVRNVEMYSLLKAVLVFIPIMKSFVFSSSYAISAHGNDQFSWKYLQGLPLTKKELIYSLTLSFILSSIPLIFCIFCFWPYLDVLFQEHELIQSKVIINFTLVLALLGITSVVKYIEYPRVEYNKKNADKKLIRFVRYSLVYICIFFGVCLGISFLEDHYNIKIFEFVPKIITAMFNFIISWWSVPILMLMIVISYLRTLKIWNNEKKSYYTNVWNPKKEYSLILLSASVLTGCYLYIENHATDMYSGKIQQSVLKNEYQEIDRLLAAKNDINNVNDYGMTPMLIAVKKGNSKMIKFLEKRGAHFEGEYTEKDDKIKYNAILLAIDSSDLEVLKYVYPKIKESNDYYNSIGFSPIHYAVSKCKVKMIDYLIEVNPNLNIRNRAGETPLLVSSRVGCFSAAVSLKDAGASFNDKDKNGKSVLELISADEYNNDFKYYLEKNMRKPANIKSSP